MYDYDFLAPQVCIAEFGCIELYFAVVHDSHAYLHHLRFVNNIFTVECTRKVYSQILIQPTQWILNAPRILCNVQPIDCIFFKVMLLLTETGYKALQ
jgi:hypothetical protein